MDKLKKGVSHNPAVAYRLKYRNKTPLVISRLNALIVSQAYLSVNHEQPTGISDSNYTHTVIKERGGKLP